MLGVQLSTGELGSPRQRGNEGPGPGAGGVDDQPGLHRPVGPGDLQRPVRSVMIGRLAVPRLAIPGRANPLLAIPGRVGDRTHHDRTAYLQIQPVLIAAVVVSDDLTGRDGGAWWVQREPGQVVDAMGPAQGQALPAMLPGAPGSGVGVEHQKVLAGHQSGSDQVVGRRQSGLSGADDDDLEGHSL